MTIINKNKTKQSKHRVVKKHIHIQDIPLKYFPKTKNNKSKEYRDELVRMMISLQKTNQNVQYSAQISIFNIKSITQKFGFVPSSIEVFRAIEDFVYHYENYCYRGFVIREKLLQFINAILPVGYKDRNVRIEHMVVNPIIKQSKLLSIIEKFKNDKSLNCIVRDRHLLTHRLYYGGSFDHYLRPKDNKVLKNKKKKEQKKWFNDWKDEIEKRAEMTNKFNWAISRLNHEIAPKIITYKNSIKK